MQEFYLDFNEKPEEPYRPDYVNMSGYQVNYYQIPVTPSAGAVSDMMAYIYDNSPYSELLPPPPKWHELTLCNWDFNTQSACARLHMAWQFSQAGLPLEPQYDYSHQGCLEAEIESLLYRKVIKDFRKHYNGPENTTTFSWRLE